MRCSTTITVLAAGVLAGASLSNAYPSKLMNQLREPNKWEDDGGCLKGEQCEFDARVRVFDSPGPCHCHCCLGLFVLRRHRPTARALSVTEQDSVRALTIALVRPPDEGSSTLGFSAARIVGRGRLMCTAVVWIFFPRVSMDIIVPEVNFDLFFGCSEGGGILPYNPCALG